MNGSVREGFKETLQVKISVPCSGKMLMLFVQSLYGISHNKIEDTKEEHLALSVRALDRLATLTLEQLAKGTL